MQYRRTPLSSGYSPSELLNGQQIRSKIDTLLPSPAHTAQGKQVTEATKSQLQENSGLSVNKLTYSFHVGAPCYALYYGHRRYKDLRWVPAIVTKVFGPRSVNVRVFPKCVIWKCHIEQLRPRYGAHEDVDPGEVPQHSVLSSSPVLLRSQLRVYHKTNLWQKPSPRKLIAIPVALLVMSMVLVIPGGCNNLRENSPRKIALRVRQPQSWKGGVMACYVMCEYC